MVDYNVVANSRKVALQQGDGQLQRCANSRKIGRNRVMVDYNIVANSRKVAPQQGDGRLQRCGKQQEGSPVTG